MNLNFRDRIAVLYMIATALIMAVVFGFVFFIVRSTVYHNLDADLAYEARKHTTEIVLLEDSIKFINKAEWTEREHREIQVNPVFIQLMNKQGQVMDRSPNLKNDFLLFEEEAPAGHFDGSLSGRAIRQVQLPIQSGGEIQGYILAAMSSESAIAVLRRLRHVLIGSYLFVLAGLYFISRFLAGRSIWPIVAMTRTISRITKHNLKERVALPPNRDELYDLAQGFNQLLDRIEHTFERERQFTSDASHELRTPLATLRGTLEVLIRRPREQAEYEAKITYCLEELERMTTMVEQLLLLARLENQAIPAAIEREALPSLIDHSLTQYRQAITEKQLEVVVQHPEAESFAVPRYYTTLLLDNLIQNAIKYSKPGGKLFISSQITSQGWHCSIQDEGIGIKKEDQGAIFQNFFRSEPLQHKQINGSGLGLSIAQKAAAAIGATITVDSSPGKGSTFTIHFPNQQEHLKPILRNPSVTP